MIDKLVEIGILFDFYGKLLTNKQNEAVKLYYLEDLSLAEIGDRMNVSRQSVFDTIKRAEKKLFEYEKNLGLVAKFSQNQNGIKKIIGSSLEIIESIENKEENNWNKNEIKERLLEIIYIGKKLID